MACFSNFLVIKKIQLSLFNKLNTLTSCRNRFSVSVLHREHELRSVHELDERLHERARHDQHRPHERALREPGGGQPPPCDARRGVAGPRGGDGAGRGRDGEHELHELHEPAAALRQRAGDEPGVRRGLRRHPVPGAQAVPAQLHARQAAVLVHLADHHGDPADRQQDADPQRAVPVDHRPVPVLPAEPAALAELHPALAVLQRLLHQGAAATGQTGEGLLLGAAPGLREHVRERLLPAAAEALQDREGRQGGGGGGGGEGGLGGRLGGLRYRRWRRRRQQRRQHPLRLPALLRLRLFVLGRERHRSGAQRAPWRTAAPQPGARALPAPVLPPAPPSPPSPSPSPPPPPAARGRAPEAGPLPPALRLQPPVLHQQPHVGAAAAQTGAGTGPGPGAVRGRRRLRLPGVRGPGGGQRRPGARARAHHRLQLLPRRLHEAARELLRTEAAWIVHL